VSLVSDEKPLLSRHQHKGGSFRIPEGVVVTGPKLVEELRQCPDDVMSFEQAVDEVCLSTCVVLMLCMSKNEPRMLRLRIHSVGMSFMPDIITMSYGSSSRESYPR
jgi:hypothetical protein